MKKIIILSISLLSTFSAFSQVRMGIKGGLNLSTISVDASNALNIDDSKMLPSFNVGVFADMPLGEIFSLQPALTLSGKGSKLTSIRISENTYGDLKLRPFYANLQTNLVFKVPLSDSFKVFVGAGPYASAGLFGKASFEGKIAGVDISKDYDIHYTSNKTDLSLSDLEGIANMKRFDFGANIAAGVELGSIILSANYEHGLINVRPGTSNKITIGDNKDDYGKNRSFNISIGFLF